MRPTAGFGKGMLAAQDEEIPKHIRDRVRDPSQRDDDERAQKAEREAREAIARSEREVHAAREALAKAISDKEAAEQAARDASDQTKKRTTGSYGQPYRTRKGDEKTKWGLHVPLEFVREFKWFEGHMALTESASDFVVRAVREKMNREVARRRKDGRWGESYDLKFGVAELEDEGTV